MKKISKRATQWKTNFNPDTTKQAQEVVFSRVHSPLIFNNVNDNWTKNTLELYLTLC